MTAHDWNDDCICTRCGYDSVEWSKRRKLDPQAVMPPCTNPKEVG